jgi:hypothetical protein
MLTGRESCIYPRNPLYTGHYLEKNCEEHDNIEFVYSMFTHCMLSLFRSIKFTLVKKIVFNLHILSIPKCNAGSSKIKLKRNTCFFMSVYKLE